MTPYPVSSWDDPSTGATWDSGLQWDVNSGSPTGNVSPYLSLFTSEYSQQPNFVAMVTVVLQPIADSLAAMQSLSSAFDLDNAAGPQLDAVGQWVGVTRFVSEPLTGVYFSFDVVGVGFDQGTWYASYDPLTALARLPDDSYRTLLRARIARNAWDGTIPGAYTVWNTAFSGTGIGVLIQDGENMHMIQALTGTIPDAVTLALFQGGYLSMRPCGVQIDAFVTPTVPDTPYFGFDVNNSAIAGFDSGAWGLASPGA